MFRGRFFSAEGALSSFAQELDSNIAQAFPEFVDGRAAANVVWYDHPRAGPGVALARGVRFDKLTAVGLYFGDVVDDLPLGEFVLQLAPFRRGGHTYHPSIDAGRLSRHPVRDPINAAFYNRSCHQETVHLARVKVGRCGLPCTIAYAKPHLPPDCPLVWDYDGGRSSGGFSVGPAERARLEAAGVNFVPCACRDALPCPRSRWFRSFH
jgi:hypothetical protein